MIFYIYIIKTYRRCPGNLFCHQPEANFCDWKKWATSDNPKSQTMRSNRSTCTSPQVGLCIYKETLTSQCGSPVSHGKFFLSFWGETVKKLERLNQCQVLMTDAPSSMDLKLHLSEKAHFFLLACPGHLSGNELKEDLILHSLLAVFNMCYFETACSYQGKAKNPTDIW